MPEISAPEWENFLSQHPNTHILQTPTWGELKATFGWEVTRVQAGDIGAQILFRRLPLGLTFAYIPKGPVFAPRGRPDAQSGKTLPHEAFEQWDQLWPVVDEVCRDRRAFFLKLEPNLWMEEGSFWDSVPPSGFQLSPHDIQPPRTLIVDLQGSEEQILGRMKQKTRYNIRLALRKGVVVRTSSDLDTFYQMMRITSQRSEFEVHSLAYFQRAYELFHPHGMCELLSAEYQEEPLAALMVFGKGNQAWYFYGASTNQHRNRMPSYILQWEAMRWARAQGYLEYDLWGVPDADRETLEADFTQRNDGLWGVYRFKRGFGGTLRRAFGPWDRVYNRVLYSFYRIWSKWQLA